MGKQWKQWQDFIFLGSKITADGDCSHEIKRCLLLGRKAMTNLDSLLKERHYSANKYLPSQSCGFSSSPVWMWELDYKESWSLKNWCFWTVVLEKILESPLDCKEIQPVHPKVNQSWIFIGRTDAETEAPNFGHLMQRTDSLEKTLILEKTAGGEGDDRGWDSWMALPNQWIWTWVSSRSWWWTGKPGVLQSMELQRERVGHDWATELNWGSRHRSIAAPRKLSWDGKWDLETKI